MGKGKDRVKARPAEIEREVEEIRDQMEPVIAELDHRRHALMDWRGQLRRRGPKVLAALVVVAGGVAAMRMWAKRSGRRGRG